MEDKNPLVLGRLGRNPDVPTVTFYGHYDVQPAMEREWATDPFEIAAIDGYLYGRGTSDNKVRTPDINATSPAKITLQSIESHAIYEIPCTMAVPDTVCIARRTPAPVLIEV